MGDAGQAHLLVKTCPGSQRISTSLDVRIYKYARLERLAAALGMSMAP
jgi:hypothetical protein